MSSPIELPTTRQSRNFHQPVNIHDPNWIPVLNKTSSRSLVSTPPSDAARPFPSRGSSKPQISKDGTTQTRSAGGPRTFPQELEGAPIMNVRPRKASLEPHNRHMSRETEDTMTSSGDDTVLSADAPSTAGTGSLLENQTYGLSRTIGIREAKSFQSSVMSDRESIISSASKRTAVPTSKYNRKPGATGSAPGTPVTASPPVLPQALTDSPRVLAIDAASHRTMSPPRLQDLGSPYSKPSSPVAQYSSTHNAEPKNASQLSIASHRLPSPPPSIQELAGEVPQKIPLRLDSLAELPSTSLPRAPPEPPTYELSSINKNRKSTASVRTTASVRKKRALHSHPSNPSMRSDKAEQGSTPTTPQKSSFTPPQGLTRTRTNESKRSIPMETEPPTEAPSAPLPDLPAKAASKKSSIRQNKPKSSEGNLSLFPQQSTLSHSPSVVNSIAKSETGQTNASSLHHSPSTFSTGGSTANPSPPQAQHRQNKSEAGSTAPHKELANFMTSKSTLIFRRFDDMHVKLLLSIQDEISVLERELLALEAASQPSTYGMQDGDDSGEEDDEDEDEHANALDEKNSNLAVRRKSKRETTRASKGAKDGGESREKRRERRKVKIMVDLRRLLAEYDHLYSNWTLMQKSTASLRDRRELERFLSSDVDTSESAREDLLWAERNAGDLSAVIVGANVVPFVDDDAMSVGQRSRSGSMTKAKALSSWGKSKGKTRTKGLGLQIGSTANGDVTTPPPSRGGLDQGSLNEKARGNGSGKRKGSTFGSWFGGCVGKRK